MTESEVQSLFIHHPFAEAKRLLIEECERNGHELQGHENVFELKALATQGAKGSINSSVSQNAVFVGGKGNGEEGAVTSNAQGAVGSGGSEGNQGGEPSQSAGGSGAGEPQNNTGEPQNNNGAPSQGQGEPSQGEPSGGEQSQSSEGEHSGEPSQEGNGSESGGGQNQQGQQKNPDENGNQEDQNGEPKEDPNGEPDPKAKKPRRRKKNAEEQNNGQEPQKNGEENDPNKPKEKTPDEKEAEANKKIEEAKKLLEEAEKEREEQRKKEEEERKKKEEQAQKNNRHRNLDEVIRRLKCLHKAFLVGPAGTGKSTLAMAACKELFNIEGGIEDVVKSDKFAQISFSPDTVSADMLGFTDVNGVFHETDIIRVFRDGGVILFDEMDDADASLLVKLNTMLANRVIPTPSGVVVQNENTYIVGTANTYGTGGNSMYVGRSRLDAATLDRWKMSTIFIDYDASLEAGICNTKLDPKQASEVMAVTKAIRELIGANKWKQICSTRFVIDCCNMMAAGYKINNCIDTFLLSWDDNSRRMVKSQCRDALKNQTLL